MSNVLLNGVTDNANGTALVLDTDGQGEIQEVGFAAYGTFGSGTCKLQGSPDGGTTWIDIASASFTANGYVVVKVPFPRVRAVLSGATSPEITAVLYGATTDLVVTAS